MSAKVKYSSAQSFRMAIQDLLLKSATEQGVDVQTVYRHTASSQFLARLFKNDDIDWALKGGHALELRLQQSRATKDIDLTLRTDKIFDSNSKNQSLRDLLVEKSKTDLDDYFLFTVSQPVMDLTGTPYGGARFSVEAKIDGKLFSKFTLDVGIGDVWLESDIVDLKNYLPETLDPGSAKVISIEQHCAEKIHAYTLPRENFNSRVKDLVDLYLIFKFEKVNKEKFKDTLTKTFKRRNTHPKPTTLPNPHELWKDRFERILKDFEAGADIDSAFNLINKFYKEIIN